MMTHRNHVLVCFCGSALKHVGTQCLMDGIVSYLPSPTQRVWPLVGTDVTTGKECAIKTEVEAPVVALVFKITHDRNRGPICFLRLYAGTLTAKTPLFNASRTTKERLTRLYHVAADELQEATSPITAGHICAVVGLKHSKTGDTLVGAQLFPRVVLPTLAVPTPVFSVSVEPESSADDDRLTEAFTFLQLEDPSFVVKQDAETGQCAMHGMGELHLDIITDRLAREFKVKVITGQLRVAYHERPSVPGSVTTGTVTESTFGNGAGGLSPRHYGQITLSIRPTHEEEATNTITWEPDVSTTTRSFPPHYQTVVTDTLSLCFSRGPSAGYPLQATSVTVHPSLCDWDADSTVTSMRLATVEAFTRAMATTSPVICEPLVSLVVDTPDGFLGDVLSDLNSTRRQASISAVTPLTRPHLKLHNTSTTQATPPARSRITATCPLAHIIGYASVLRSVTKGEGSFVTQPSHSTPVGEITRRRLMGEKSY